ncbi:MAG: hypothetical protein KGZ96_03835 [Clostridia bacterium]|nr:hypothetical protein [Clostridia bacterium]
MKQLIILFPLSAAGFTFAITLIIALINGATLITSIGRGFLSALIILLICLLIGVVIKKTFANQETTDNKIEQMPSSSTRNAADKFQSGYEHLTAKKANTQVEHDLVELLQSDPGRATELLRKMKAE